jgi:L-2,4-diaminobutyrate decarboxylase
LYRDRAHRFETFRQEAPYLFDPSAPGLAEYDSGMRTVECTKRAAAFGLWGIWSMFGPQLLADLVDVTFGLGRVLYEKLLATPDFQPVHEPQCNIVVFRYVPSAMKNVETSVLGRFQLELRRRLIESGDFYIVSTSIDGIGALRVTIINPLTTPEDLDHLLDALRFHGAALMVRQHTTTNGEVHRL